MAEEPTFKIPKEVIEPIIQAQVVAAVASAIDKNGAVLKTFINRVLQINVDASGKPTGYNGTPFIEWAVGDVIQKVVHECLVEEFAKHKEIVRENIIAQLRMKNSPLVQQFVGAMTEAFTAKDHLKWNLEVTYRK